MSILTDLAQGRITWHQAATEIEAWGASIVSKDPALTAAAGTIIADVKQAASNAIGSADTALGAWIIPASKTVELALDGVLAGATKGLSLPFNPFLNDGIDTIANAIKAEADTWALKAKAGLGASATAAPSQASQPPSQVP